MLQARKVGIAHGWMWLKQGLWLFKRNAFLWMFLCSVFVVGTFGIAMLPMVGELLLQILRPAFFAGLMIGAHALAEEKELEINHLFAGFRKHGTPLITLGVISAAALLLIVGLLELGGGSQFIELMRATQHAPTEEEMRQAVAQAGVMLPICFALVALLQPSILFGSMLIVFRGVAPMPALLAGLRATLLNLLPLLVYGFMVLPFAVLATMPAMLGWIVLLPILLTTQYAIYRDIFPMPEDVAGPPQAEPPDPDAPSQD